VVSERNKVAVDYGPHYCQYRYAISNRVDILVGPGHAEWLVIPSSQQSAILIKVCAGRGSTTHFQRAWEGVDLELLADVLIDAAPFLGANEWEEPICGKTRDSGAALLTLSTDRISDTIEERECFDRFASAPAKWGHLS
jgi:hypothetical protein